MSIVFKSDASMFNSPSTVIKQEYRSMTEHPGLSSSETTTPSNHSIPTKWNPSDRKVTITIQADVIGYGEARASINSINSGIDGVPVLNITGDVMNVGSWGGGEVTGAASASPKAYTVSHEAYFYCPPDAQPDNFTWSADGNVEIWGVRWNGTGTVQVTETIGADLGLLPEGTYQARPGVASSVTDNVNRHASDRLKSTTGTWTVVHTSDSTHE